MSHARRVDLVCDGGPGIGYGHVRRTLTLAQALRSAGAAVGVSALSAPAQALLPSQPAHSGAATVGVFDAPGGLDEAMQRARESGQCVVALDWFGAFEPDVNIAVYPHGPVRARRRSYVGLDYQLIREEIASLPRGAEGHGVVVLLGGGDVLGQGHAAAQRLAQQGLEVTLIQGPLAVRRDASTQYRVLVDPPELPALLAGCAWAVTNGGGCMFEAMCLGKAAVALPQTDAEELLARRALEQGALLGIGMDCLRPRAGEPLRTVAQKAAALVDGRGARRVADIVMELL